MQANHDGIGLTKPMLRALLEFASTDARDTNKCGVQFVVKGDRCFARASDGRRAVECVGASDGQCSEGEWLVSREFLVAVTRLLSGHRVARLQFDAANLYQAILEEDGNEVSSFHVETSAAVAQKSLFDIAQLTKIPKSERSTNCVALPAAYMAGLSLVGKAMGSDVAIECFAPKTPDDPAIYRIGDGGQVQWVVAILPWTTEETHGQSQSNGTDWQTAFDDVVLDLPAPTPGAQTPPPRKGIQTPRQVQESLKSQGESTQQPKQVRESRQHEAK